MLMSLSTLFIARLAALFKKDSKKIVAFSTMSQLGLMSVALAVGAATLCLFHLFTHAIFKALLFIKMGYFLLINLHAQDLRSLNLLKESNPFLTLSQFICLLRLAGFFFMSGFYSKDLVIELFYFK
jgi:NADH-quinone oxidoreductase subunit L